MHLVIGHPSWLSVVVRMGSSRHSKISNALSNVKDDVTDQNQQSHIEAMLVVVIMIMPMLVMVLVMPVLVVPLVMPMLVFFKKMREGVDEDVTEDTARGKS